MIKLFDYQQEAVDELHGKLCKMLSYNRNGICVFKAPTGSGKTIVVASLLRRLVIEEKTRISVIWIAPRKLHNQSKEKLEKLYDDHTMVCSDFEDLDDNKIKQNEILFFNWESITKKNNIYIMDNEQDKNLSNVIKNTRKAGHKIILVIDESHYAAKGEKSKQLVHGISPDVTLEVSATPQLKDYDEICTVYVEDVKEAEMIKSRILINPKFSQVKIDSRNTDRIVIEEALKQRKQLQKGFQSEGSKVNPLMLIQIPDRKALMEDKRDTVVNILKDFGITENNGKLAIWLSEEKSDTLPNIEQNDNNVEVLIFKQAISIGWDCPRASILVVFRDYTSFEFTIQTIGRIMRMPELKYYDKSPELNDGYIYTNLERIDLTAEYVSGYVTQHESYRHESSYRSIKLKSTHIKRAREITRLSSKFIRIFNDSSITKGLKPKINTKPENIKRTLPSDGEITDIDETGHVKTEGSIDVNATEKQIREGFNNFVRSACSPYAPYDSSDSLKKALYTFLNKNFGVEKYSVSAQRIVMDEKNYQHFLDAINHAKMKYEQEVVKASKKGQIEETEWEVPKRMSFGDDASQTSNKKSIMQPFYHVNLSGPEHNFIKRLSKSDKVKWWYKNGETEKKYFAVPYVDENGYTRGFYVDFVVQFKDGKIGLFDTKGGGTARGDGAKYRHDGLYKYLKNENKKVKKLFGGLAVEKNGTWYYYSKKNYQFDEKNMLSWDVLDL